MSTPLPRARRRTHAASCPDPDELYALHDGDCPCPWCLDTGYIDADPQEIDCDCGAELRPENERRADCDRIARYR